MTMKPIISVISPVYNVEKYIKNLIISLNNQTFKNFELILVDDGSKDDSIKEAKKELEKTDIFYKIISKENGGQSTARNVGIKEASGEWLVLLDSDDTIQTNYLKNLYESVKDIKKCDIAFCDMHRVTDNNCFEELEQEFKTEVNLGRKFFVDFIMHNVEIGPCLLLINTSFLKNNNIYFNENSRYSEEFIFICSLLHNAENVVHLKQKLYNYCLRKGSVSTGAKTEKIINGFNQILFSNETYDKCNCKFCKLYNKYAMPRWILATARFTAKNLKYKDYSLLLNKLDSKKYLKKLFDFPSLKVRISAIVAYYFKYPAYLIFKLTKN